MVDREKQINLASYEIMKQNKRGKQRIEEDMKVWERKSMSLRSGDPIKI